MKTVRDVYYSNSSNNYCRECGCSIPDDYTLCRDCWDWAENSDPDEDEYIWGEEQR